MTRRCNSRRLGASLLLAVSKYVNDDKDPRLDDNEPRLPVDKEPLLEHDDIDRVLLDILETHDNTTMLAMQRY